MSDSFRKAGIVLATLATGVYRPWYWQNYKDKDAQEQLRRDYQRFVESFDIDDIRAALREWEKRNGADNPPSPDSLFALLSSAVNHRRAALSSIKQRLGA